MADETPRIPPATPGNGPLPRPPGPGPSGEKARIAAPEDAAEVARLLSAFLRETGRKPAEDRVGWVVQSVVREPLRGIHVIAESREENPPAALALASISTAIDPARGWIGWFVSLYVEPDQRRRGVAGWLVAEALEFARHHGINHIRVETGPGDAIAHRILRSLPVAERDTRVTEIDLHPHFDDGTA
jgi:GNAT superfamily N-acetyltransferase